jgi:hypothetical protein
MRDIPDGLNSVILGGTSDRCFFCGYPSALTNFPENFDIMSPKDCGRTNGYRKYNERANECELK